MIASRNHRFGRAYAALVVASSLAGCGGEVQRTGAKDPPRAEAHRAKMNALWSPARQARLEKAVRSASPAFGDADVERLGERVDAWTDAWVMTAAQTDRAQQTGDLRSAEATAVRACLAVESTRYAAQLDGLSQGCLEPGCHAERVANLDWDLVEAEQSSRACMHRAHYKAYLGTNLARPEAIETQGKLLALDALGDAPQLERSLTATLKRQRSASAFRTRLLMLEARRLLRALHPEAALALIDEAVPEAQRRGDALQLAALQTERSNAHLALQEFPAALADATRALESSRRALGDEGDERPEIASARAHLADVAIAGPKPDLIQAAQQLERARLALTRTLGPTHPYTAQVELSLGGLAAATGHAEAARHWLTRGTSSTAAAFGTQHLLMANAVRFNAHAESAQGNTRAALALYARALELERRVLGEVHARVAQGWEALGVQQRLAGQPLAALASYRHSLQICRKLYGKAHPQVVVTLLSMSSTYAALDRPTDALREAERAEGLLASIPEHQRARLAPLVCETLSDLNATLGRSNEGAWSCEPSSPGPSH